ncbi:hypothetical protein BDL97_06G102600 [Sphagnum fallax]|nr:hypothetical protein BDL97_06G102600 [Sphagnum fallax]
MQFVAPELLSFPTSISSSSLEDRFGSSRSVCAEKAILSTRNNFGVRASCSSSERRTVPPPASVKADPGFSIETRPGMSPSFESVSTEPRTLPQVLLVPDSGTAAAAAPQTSGLSADSVAGRGGYEYHLKGLRAGVHNPKLVVVGHRGCGKNKSLSQGEAIDSRPSIRENTIASFNQAARNGADYVEFDVQVTKDRHAIIFHDDYIIVDDKVPRKIGDLTLEEFVGIGPQKNFAKEGRSLYRNARDGTLNPWTVTMEDPLCTLEEAFKQVDPSVGFNIEVKFDDIDETSDVELQRVIYPIVESVRQHSNGRRIYFSSFHPDAVHLLRSLQSTYPVFFLTNGGGCIYNDQRRNSIQAAIAVCQQGQLQGIVTEVQAVLHEPSLISLIKAANLWVFTYGEFNNVEEAVRKQKDAGVDGVIVDHVLEIVKLEHQLEDQHPPISSSYSTTSSRTAILPVF